MKKSTRKAMNISGTGLCDICGTPDFLETHHINGRNIENYNNDFNLTSICPSCHYKIHLGEIIISAWYMSTSGRMLVWKNKDSDQEIAGKVAKPCIIPRKEKL